MGYPPQPPQGPYGPSHGQSGPQYPPPHAQAPYPQQQGHSGQPYPMQPYANQQPMHVQQVGRAVTKPVWSVGDICLVVFTCGFAYPIVWASRRKRTTITRHR